MFAFLKIAPNATPITDGEKISKAYRYWRFRVLYALLVGYASFYLVRKSLAVAMPAIEEEFDISKAHLGLILTLFGLTYGVSKFLNGFAGDRSNPRYFMAMGLLCSVAVNIFFGLSGGLATFSIFWILNGWFQGMGWAPCSRTLVQWFSAKERGFKFAIANTSTSIGASTVVILNGYLIIRYGWRVCFFVPAGIAFLGALFVLNRLRDRPQSLGLPPVEEYTGEEADLSDTDDGKGITYKQSVSKFIFKNPGMWLVCLANFFVYVVRYTVLDWGVTFLKQAKGIDTVHAAWIIGGYEIAGIIGMLIGGLAMDKLFKGYGGRTCFFFMAFCGLFIFLFWKLPVQSMLANGMLLWAVGFMIYGPQCLVAVVAANMVPKQAGAAAVGFTGLFGYLSTVVSGWGLGALVEKFGWNTGFLVLVFSATVGMFLFGMLWKSNPHLPGTRAYHEHNDKITASETGS